ncbi:hypothetical protein, partial [Acinetobacter baumannii]|uniref:hypothetical protein n=1 Tax=Acinetobacter baumannii TaxID=470 RepID=UPI00189840A9
MPNTPDPLACQYQGKRYRVVHCAGALDSYRKALKHVDARRVGSFTRGMILQIERLANGQAMSNENFPKEGELPKRKGQQTAKYFRALKRIPIRGYCWRSETWPDTWFISHYVYKDYTRLAGKDTRKVERNWLRIEEN